MNNQLLLVIGWPIVVGLLVMMVPATRLLLRGGERTRIQEPTVSAVPAEPKTGQSKRVSQETDEERRGAHAPKQDKEPVSTEGRHRYRIASGPQRIDRRWKRNERALEIQRIGAAARAQGMNYIQFIDGLSRAQVQIDRKGLLEMIDAQPDAFAELVKKAKTALRGARAIRRLDRTRTETKS